MIAFVHVHTERLRDAAKPPPIRVVFGDRVAYGNEVEFTGPSRLPYTPDQPLDPIKQPRAVAYLRAEADHILVDGLPLSAAPSIPLSED